MFLLMDKKEICKFEMKRTERPEDVLHLDDVSRYYVDKGLSVIASDGSVNNAAVNIGKFNDVWIFRS